jgi:hypothetical protein
MKQGLKLMTPAAALGVVVLMAGCVTTKFHEVVVDADGSSATTSYKASSSAWPGGKLETANHTWHYGWGLDTAQNEITTGQAVAGIDNSGVTALVEVLTKFMAEALTAYMSRPADVVQPSALPGIIDALAPLFAK